MASKKKEKTLKPEFVVITGGPGAGKTALLEAIRKTLCPHATILPESATIIFGGGFWRLESINARKCAQRAIFQVQREMENLVIGEGKWSTVLCDRGSIDALAYWPNSEGSFWKSFLTTKKKEYARYKAVIHLRTPNDSLGYNHQNPVRIETAEAAALIDNRIANVWEDHPQYRVIESQSNFLDKLEIAVESITQLLPGCCESDS